MPETDTNIKIITSAMISFVDTTDSRILDLSLSSNLPTVQIYDPTSNTYTPDWSVTNLNIISQAFVENEDISESESTFYTWYVKYDSGNETQIANATDKVLEVASNLSSHNIVTYRCVVTYQGLTASESIVFNKSQVGAKGSDGTSVNILGSAYSNMTLVVGNWYDLYSDNSYTTEINTNDLNNKDAFLVNGNLCVYDSTKDKFMCAGKIQGPPGQDGQDAKQIILSATSQIIRVNQNGTPSPSIVNVIGTGINTNITSWMYSNNGGRSFTNTLPTGISRDGNLISISSTTMNLNSIVIKASDGLISDIITISKVYDGKDGGNGNTGDPASNVFLSNNNIYLIGDPNGNVVGKTITINVIAYTGKTKVTPTLGNITGLPSGMTINSSNITTSSNEKILPFVINNGTNLGSPNNINGIINIPITYPVNTNIQLNWCKLNSNPDNADTGWITLNNEIKYRKKNGYVNIIGESNNSEVLNPNEYTIVGIMPTGYNPDINMSFQSKDVDIYIDVNGNIKLFTSNENINSWNFNVIYPI